jgi:spore coat protein CotH
MITTMKSIRHLWAAVALAGAALIVLAATLAGCGPAASASISSADSIDQILATRYDDVFPDDRVQTVRILMKDEDWAALKARPAEEQYYRADIWIDGERIPDVAVRPKGNSSLMQVVMSGSKRVGLKVDLNFFNSARSYHGIKKINYNNGFSDPTLMKEFLGYELMAGMGLPTPRACFVDLWVNDMHLGVYTEVEQVDPHFLAENFQDARGNLYKPELAAGALRWTEEDAAAQAARSTGTGGTASAPGGATTSTTGAVNMGGGDLEEIIERAGEDAGWIPGRGTITTAAGGSAPGFAGGPMGGFGTMSATDLLTSVGLKTNENSPDHSALFALLDVLNRDPAATTAADLERVLDVDECLRFLAVSAVLVHLDNYIGSGHNYYLYEQSGRFSIIPWDLNMSFGGFDGGLSRDRIIGFYIDEPTSGKLSLYPLAAQLLAKPEYLEAYHRYLEQIVTGPFSEARMRTRIDEMAALIRPYVQRDDLKFFSTADFEQGLSADLTGSTGMRTMGGAFIGLMAFVAGRDASIAAQLDGRQPATNSDGSGNGGVQGIGGGPGGPGGPGGGFGPPGGFNPPGALSPPGR